MSWITPTPDQEVFLNGQKLELVLQANPTEGKARIVAVDWQTGERLYDPEAGDYQWVMVAGVIEVRAAAPPRPIKERLDELKAQQAEKAQAKKVANPMNPYG